jgi:hypothetical protein
LYLALGLGSKKKHVPLFDYDDGFPHKVLFFECLRPWKWRKMDMDIIIENANIELNVSEYYRSRQDTLNHGNGSRLARENPSPSTRITEQYYIHIISSENQDPDQFHCYHDGERYEYLHIQVSYGDTLQIWRFDNREYGLDTGYDNSDSEDNA